MCQAGLCSLIRMCGLGLMSFDARKISYFALLFSSFSLLVISFLSYFFKVLLIYNVVPISIVQQSDPVSHTYIHFFLILSSIVVYPKRLDIVPCAVQ